MGSDSKEKKDKERSSSKDKDKESSSSKRSSKDKDKDKERDKERDRDKERSRSSSKLRDKDGEAFSGVAAAAAFMRGIATLQAQAANQVQEAPQPPPEPLALPAPSSASHEPSNAALITPEPPSMAMIASVGEGVAKPSASPNPVAAADALLPQQPSTPEPSSMQTAAADSAPSCAPLPTSAPSMSAAQRSAPKPRSEPALEFPLGGKDIAAVLGSASQPGLYDEYRRCLASLEGLIVGPMAAKKNALAEMATRIETNIAAVQAAAAAVQSENDNEAEATNARLERATRQKLMLLQHELSACLLDIDAIEKFGDDVASTSGLSLLQREPELLGKARRLSQTPVPSVQHVPADDLPREAAARAAQLQRVEQLEQLLQAN